MAAVRVPECEPGLWNDARCKAAWKADPVGHMIRLAPDAPKRMWTYRFNVIDA